MTLQPPSPAELSSPVTAIGNSGGTPARQLTEPMRELFALALLVGNAVFLFLGLSRLLFVIDGWASQFGQRCVAVFPAFVGLLALTMPMAALVLATHFAPMVPRSKLIMLGVIVEYGVSAVFGAITFLGAFAEGLSSARATIEGTLERAVWIAFLVLGCVVVARLQLKLYPRPRPRTYPESYLPATYGQPYPGQPLFPQTYPPQRQHNSGSPASISGDPYAQAATSGSGWPAVPPPPMPDPLVVDPDPTTRIELPVPVTVELGGDATQILRAPQQQTSSAHE